MFYIITYLYVGTLIVILSNLSVFLLRKNEDNLELPFVISWFGFVMNLFSFSLKNFLTAINIVIFFPFLNLYLAYDSFQNLWYNYDDFLWNELLVNYIMFRKEVLV